MWRYLRKMGKAYMYCAQGVMGQEEAFCWSSHNVHVAMPNQE